MEVYIRITQSAPLLRHFCTKTNLTPQQLNRSQVTNLYRRWRYTSVHRPSKRSRWHTLFIARLQEDVLRLRLRLSRLQQAMGARPLRPGVTACQQVWASLTLEIWTKFSMTLTFQKISRFLCQHHSPLDCLIIATSGLSMWFTNSDHSSMPVFSPPLCSSLIYHYRTESLRH